MNNLYIYNYYFRIQLAKKDSVHLLRIIIVMAKVLYLYMMYQIVIPLYALKHGLMNLIDILPKIILLKWLSGIKLIRFLYLCTYLYLLCSQKGFPKNTFVYFMKILPFIVLVFKVSLNK